MTASLVEAFQKFMYFSAKRPFRTKNMGRHDFLNFAYFWNCLTTAVATKWESHVRRILPGVGISSSPHFIIGFMSTRGIRYLTDQNSLINPGPLMHLNMFYSNSFWKNCKILASETILVYEMKWPSVTGAEVIGTYYVNQIFLFQFSLKIIDRFQRRRLSLEFSLI